VEVERRGRLDRADGPLKNERPGAAGKSRTRADQICGWKGRDDMDSLHQRRDRINELAIESYAARVLELESERDTYRDMALEALTALQKLTAENTRLHEHTKQLREWNNTLIAAVERDSLERSAAA